MPLKTKNLRTLAPQGITKWTYLVQRTSWWSEPWHSWHCVHNLPKSISSSDTAVTPPLVLSNKKTSGTIQYNKTIGNWTESSRDAYLEILFYSTAQPPFLCNVNRECDDHCWTKCNKNSIIRPLYNWHILVYHNT